MKRYTPCASASFSVRVQDLGLGFGLGLGIRMRELGFGLGSFALICRARAGNVLPLVGALRTVNSVGHMNIRGPQLFYSFFSYAG